MFILNIVWLGLICRTGNGGPATQSFMVLRYNINQIEMSISNFGCIGQTHNGTAGCWWPRGSGQNYIFGAGIWFGTIDSLNYWDRDSLVTIGYGPHGGESEFGPGLTGWSVEDEAAIIYMAPDLYPPPQNRYPMAPQEALSHQDSWCAFNDADPSYHMPGDTRPIGIEVYQTVYAWDLPMLLDVIYLHYTLKNVSGKKLTKCYYGFCADCDIGNESGGGNDIVYAVLRRWYRFPNGDSIWIENLACQWQEEVEGGWSPPVPGAIGFDYLQSPFDLVAGADKDQDSISDEHEKDSAYFVNSLPPSKWDVNANAIPDWRDPAEIPQLGLTAYRRFTLNLEPNKDSERYQTMAGYNFKTGAYCPYDTEPAPPDDQRFLMGSGPFNLEPDSTVTIVVGFMITRWHGIFLRADTALALLDHFCQSTYDLNWLVPRPPPPPMLTCIPGDNKVTLIWNNLSEVTPDPYYYAIHNTPYQPIDEPYYQPYDFQGFRIWRSRTGQPSDWILLAARDKADDITFRQTDPYLPESLWIEATDNGIVHSYVDDEVLDGFKYYYAVTAFDRNFLKGIFDSLIVDTFYVSYDTLGNPDTIWDYDTIKVAGPVPLTGESGQTIASAVPRREAGNYVPAGTPFDSVASGHPLLDSLIRPVVTSPFDIDPDRALSLELAEPEYHVWTESDTLAVQKRYAGAVYRVMLKNGSGVIVDSIRSAIKIGSGYGPYEFAACNGMAVTCDVGTPLFTENAINLFEDVIVPQGGYPETLLVPEVLSPIPNFQNAPNYAQGFWAYRGHDYELTWHAAGGKSRTATVVDAYTGDTIPFYAFKNDTVTAPEAACWCFTRSALLSSPFPASGTDTLEYRGSPGTRTKSVYIMGGMINLKKGVGIDSLILPQDAETWIVKANSDYLPPSVAGRVVIRGFPGYFGSTRMALSVKVVPNPYVLSNAWQQTPLIRRLRFINLPNQCTIRVFNLNGELVKTMLHAETTPVSSGSYNNAAGEAWWNLLNEFNQLIASGVYIFHVESAVGNQTGKFAVIR